MKKSYLTFFALLLSASIAFSTHSTLAVDSAAQTAPATTAPPSTNTAEPAATPPADNSTLNLSLEDALKSVETGNSTLKLTDSQIEIYDKQNEQTLARQNANIPVVDEDSKKDLSLNYKRTQWTLDNAKHDRDTKLKALKVQITNEYEGVLTLRQQAENTKKQLANLETIINQVNLQIKLGLKIPSDIYSYNAQKTRLEASVKAITNTVNSSMITLKQDLGIDINRNVILTSDPIQYTVFDEKDIYGRITKATQDNYDLKKYKEDIDISQIEYDIDFFYDDTMVADQVQLGIEDKKAKLQTLPVNQEVQLKTAYNSLKSLENTIEADKLAVEADQINVDVMQKSIDAGKMSSLDMIALQNALLNDQFTLQQDTNTYMTAAMNFQNSLDN
ncbi:TolC family protein [Desulfosporosinus sp. Sb-LF]|uniref:TolC family protein n=1 Tax=Desulfosporosinus sp. Sb-LF TaxID=2560027 RepID=UPI001FB081A5|nr:TolC family protein [Desulfosporosinus sp. Sb-LF]